MVARLGERSTYRTSKPSTPTSSVATTRPIHLTLDNIHTALLTDEPALHEEISIVIGFCAMNIGEQPSPQQCKQVGLAIAALKPTRRQLYEMYRRFILNPNYADFAVHRFTNKALPLYSEEELEKRIAERTKTVDERLHQLIKTLQFDCTKYAAMSEYVLAQEYLHLKELRFEMMTAYYRHLEEKKEQERLILKRRIARVWQWIANVDEAVLREALTTLRDRGLVHFNFKPVPAHPVTPAILSNIRRHNEETLKRYNAYPTDEEIQLHRRYPQGYANGPLFELVEQYYMRLLPQGGGT